MIIRTYRFGDERKTDVCWRGGRLKLGLSDSNGGVSSVAVHENQVVFCFVINRDATKMLPVNRRLSMREIYIIKLAIYRLKLLQGMLPCSINKLSYTLKIPV